MIPLPRKRTRIPAIITVPTVDGCNGELVHAYSAYEISHNEYLVTDGIVVSHICDTPYEAIAVALKLAGWQRCQLASEIMKEVLV